MTDLSHKPDFPEGSSPDQGQRFKVLHACLLSLLTGDASLNLTQHRTHVLFRLRVYIHTGHFILQANLPVWRQTREEERLVSLVVEAEIN